MKCQIKIKTYCLSGGGNSCGAGCFMTTNKLVKQSKEGKDFFESAADNSIVLDLVISFQTGSAKY